MSNYTGLLPSFGLVGNNGPLIAPSQLGYPFLTFTPNFYPGSGHYPAIADSYLPQYSAPQTKYGSCVCHGGGLNSNNCNFEQGGFRPQCLVGGGCRCINTEGDNFG